MHPNGAAFRSGIWNTSRLLTWISAANLISSELRVPNWILEIFLGAEDLRIGSFRSIILWAINSSDKSTVQLQSLRDEGHSFIQVVLPTDQFCSLHQKIEIAVNRMQSPGQAFVCFIDSYIICKAIDTWNVGDYHSIFISGNSIPKMVIQSSFALVLLLISLFSFQITDCDAARNQSSDELEEKLEGILQWL